MRRQQAKSKPAWSAFNAAEVASGASGSSQLAASRQATQQIGSPGTRMCPLLASISPAFDPFSLLISLSPTSDPAGFPPSIILLLYLFQPNTFQLFHTLQPTSVFSQLIVHNSFFFFSTATAQPNRLACRTFIQNHQSLAKESCLSHIYY